MSKEINKSNYEEFYLDFLEGNLSGEVLVAFEAFLAANPDLAIENDLLILEPDTEEFGSFDKLLLKKQVAIAELNAGNIDYFLISSTEGLLSEKDQAYLTSWLNENPQFKRDAALVAATKSEADLSVIYEDKEALKHKTRIIPLWLSGVAAAAAAVLLIITFSWNTGEVGKPGSSVAKADQNDTVETPIDQKEDSKQLPSDKTDPEERVFVKSIKTKNNTVSPVEVPSKKKASGEIDELELRRATIQTQPSQLAELSIPKTQTVNAIPATEPVSYATIDKMANPIKPVTKAISEKLDTPVDFRTAKANKKQGGGFYLKVGKLEISHQTASLY